MASRYTSNLHQRDQRTQLFSHVGPYNPAQVINSSSNSRASTPYQTATPENSYYSDAVLQQLESQNDEQIEGLSAKVKLLKDVSGYVA
jgi:blocked-early-in-transport protein 1